MRSTRTLIVAAAAAAVLLAAASLGLMVLLGGLPLQGAVTARPGCTAPALPGTVVNVAEVDRGMPMMGGRMRLTPDRATVPHGTVSFSVSNLGGIPHELLVMPLAQGQAAGARTVGPDGRIDETGALGEASASCAAGAGQGILPGTVSWVTLDLAPGRYELLCNYPGHYLDGMRALITVR